MALYDLSKQERVQRYIEIQDEILREIQQSDYSCALKYFDDGDTYIRKAAYLAVGRLYNGNKKLILDMLQTLINSESERVRQTLINSAGEIAMFDFAAVEPLFEVGLTDAHHSVRNAVQGSLKKSGEKNPGPVIAFCKKHITSENPEVRRTVAHGLELRGRTHPEDIMPVLRLLQFEKHKRVRPMLIHIFGQISYKKGCLEKVTSELLTWEDVALADECFAQIIEQHKHINNHFRTLETLSPKECEEYILKRRALT